MPLKCWARRSRTAGRFTPEQIRDTVRVTDGTHVPPTKIVSVENTHNASGGRVWPIEEIEAVAATARELGLRLHLDGARLMNASVASGVPSATIGGHFDTVTLCLSKGLGCPLGALVAGSGELMATARRFKHLFGGAMRQAGIVAAAALHALEHHVDRLAEDHARARRLAERLAEAGLPVDVAAVETNFIGIDVGSMGIAESDAQARIAEEGVLVGRLRPGVLRVATYLGVTDEDVERAAVAIPRALVGAVARA